MEPAPRHSVSVAAAVVNDREQVLAIQRRDNGHWEPPGGVLELSESIEDGLRREVREETGVEVDVVRLTGVYKNMRRGIVALVFRCRPAAGRATPTEESAASAWLDAEDIEASMDEAYAVRLLDALGDSPEVAVRSHDGMNLL
ncbi:NUDIX domain-containing protein [Salsipaludibacter albus]|uniref:NUDIX hydrolase n=1 Tax=Salsipaludibacter albus TaxID=2849650 RepID=UPI001EE4110B|nr:NUDIX domain-containing protein [Salsipaludibacter albus]